MIRGKKISIEGQITISLDGNRARIEIVDRNACTRFLDLEMTPADFVAALGRQAYMPCSVNVFGLDALGKEMKHKHYEFPLKDNSCYGMKERAREEIFEALERDGMEGWEPDLIFSSQGSFRFDSKTGVMYAATIIRKWVPVTMDGNSKSE